MSSGASWAYAKPRVGLVELQRADAEVEQHALHPATGPRPASTSGSSSYTACTSGDAVAVRREPRAAAAQRLGVAVQPDEPGRRRLEQRLGVTAHAEGAVDDDGVRCR